MAASVREVRVFLASPGDVKAERSAVRNVEAQLNVTLSATGFRVRITGYEDLPPGYGRPQSLINPMVDDCDLFVGILRRRWGSDTGVHETGFIEEFERATERRIRHRIEPEISLYFAELDTGEIDDAGPDLTEVLKFRARVEEEHIALYSTFRTEEDLARQVTTLLTQHLVNRSLNAVKPTVSDGTTSNSGGESRTAQAEEVSPENAKHLGEAGVQITTVLDTLRDLVRGDDPARPLDRDRLELLGAAMSQDDQVLGAHLVNRLYQRRDELTLVVAEHTAWVTTLLADIGSAPDLGQRVVPGWGVLDPNEEDTAATLAGFATNDSAAGRGAVRSLLRLGLRPRSLWPRPLTAGSEKDLDEITAEDRVNSWVHLLEAHPVDATNLLLHELDTTNEAKHAALSNLLAGVAGTEGLNLECQAIVSAAREAIGGSYDSLISELATRADLPAAWRLVISHIDDITSASLNELARQSHNSGARLAATRVGLGRNILTDDTLANLLLVTDDPELIDLLVQSVAGNGDKAIRYVSVMRAARKVPPSATEARLLAAPASIEQLKQLNSTSDLSITPWEALTYAAPGDFLDEARGILRTGGQALRQRTAEKLGNEAHDVVSYLAEAQQQAAANLLARQPHVEIDDVELVLAWFQRAITSSPLRDDTWGPLEQVADRAGGSRIEAALRPHVGRLVNLRVLQILDSGEKSELAHALANVLVNSDVDLMVQRARRWHLKQPERTRAELEEALYDEDAAVRAGAAEALAKRLTTSELVTLQERYPRRRERYWYNVVACFDQYLYAPSPEAT